MLEQVYLIEFASDRVPSYGFFDIEFKFKLLTTLTHEGKHLVSRFVITDNTSLAEDTSITTKKVYDYEASLYFEENQSQRFVQIFAMAFSPLVNFSQQEYNMAEVELGHSNKTMVEISNPNLNLNQSVDICMPCESFLHFDQKRISLRPDEAIQLEAVFCPNNLDVFDHKLAFKFQIGFVGKFKMTPKALQVGSNSKIRSCLPQILKSAQLKLSTSQMSSGLGSFAARTRTRLRSTFGPPWP